MSGTPRIDAIVGEWRALDEAWKEMIARLQLTGQREKEIAGAAFQLGRQFEKDDRAMRDQKAGNTIPTDRGAP